MAVAAIRDAMRIFSTVSASLMRRSPSSRGLAHVDVVRPLDRGGHRSSRTEGVC